MSKVIQLCVSATEEGPDYLYALCEDGSVWMRCPEVTSAGARIKNRWIWTEVKLGPEMREYQL